MYAKRIFGQVYESARDADFHQVVGAQVQFPISRTAKMIRTGNISVRQSTTRAYNDGESGRDMRPG